jgi:hypothetical protein
MPAKPARTRSPNYTPMFRAAVLAALDANGGNVKKTAREFGIKSMTLKGWATNRTKTDPELRTLKKIELDQVLEDFARQMCGITISKVKGLSLRDLGIALGITIDKILLLRGQPNVISKSETAAATIDLTQLSRDELLTLLRLQEKAAGVPALPLSADLDNPVIVSDDAAPHAAE